MLSLGRKSVLSLSTVALLGAMANNVHATRFTEEATFNFVSNDPNTVQPVINSEIISGFDGSGGFFSNTFTTPDINGAVQINAVGAIELAGVKLANNSTVGGIRSPFEPDARVTVIFALTGTSSLVNGVPVENVSAGRAIVIQGGDAGSFSRLDPQTWNWASIDAANVLAVYDLAGKDNLATGNGDTRAESASVMNQISINAATTVQIQGRLMFDLESQNPLLPAGGPLLSEGIFQQNEGPLAGLPGSEGIYVEPDGTVFSDLTELNNAFDASDLAIVNDIFDQLIDGTDDGSPLFASGLNNGLASGYNPVPSSQLSIFNPDFAGDLGIEVVPTSSAAVPEPASAVLGLMALAGLAFRGRRTRIA